MKYPFRAPVLLILILLTPSVYGFAAAVNGLFGQEQLFFRGHFYSEPGAIAFRIWIILMSTTGTWVTAVMITEGLHEVILIEAATYVPKSLWSNEYIQIPTNRIVAIREKQRALGNVIEITYRRGRVLPVHKTVRIRSRNFLNKRDARRFVEELRGPNPGRLVAEVAPLGDTDRDRA